MHLLASFGDVRRCSLFDGGQQTYHLMCDSKDMLVKFSTWGCWNGE